MPSLFAARLLSLARQVPSPAVVVATCSRPLPVSVPLPAVVVAACSRPLPVSVRTAALAIPSTSVVQRRHNHCPHQAPPPPPPLAFWAKTFHIQRNSIPISQKQKSVICNLSHHSRIASRDGGRIPLLRFLLSFILLVLYLLSIRIYFPRSLLVSVDSSSFSYYPQWIHPRTSFPKR